MNIMRLFGWISLIALIIGLCVWGIYALVTWDNARCSEWKTTLTSVSVHDPADFPTVLEMYTDECS